MRESNTTATEIIADLTKKLNTVNADTEYFYRRLRQAKAIFGSIRYAMAEGVIDDEEACMDGFYNLLDVLQDVAEESCSRSNQYVEEVM